MQTVKRKDGKILTENNGVKNRWKENYQELYNNKNLANEEMAETIPQMLSMEEEPPIMREEVVIKVMAEGKAPDFDCVTGEELKHRPSNTFCINCVTKSGKRKPSLISGAGLPLLPSSKRRIIGL